jgi:hypothetical protein
MRAAVVASAFLAVASALPTLPSSYETKVCSLLNLKMREVVRSAGLAGAGWPGCASRQRFFLASAMFFFGSPLVVGVPLNPRLTLGRRCWEWGRPRSRGVFEDGCVRGIVLELPRPVAGAWRACVRVSRRVSVPSATCALSRGSCTPPFRPGRDSRLWACLSPALHALISGDPWCFVLVFWVWECLWGVGCGVPWLPWLFGG